MRLRLKPINREKFDGKHFSCLLNTFVLDLTLPKDLSPRTGVPALS